MINPFRRRRERLAKERILRALDAVRAYERGHVERQEKRLQDVRLKLAPGRRHGTYDADQVVDAVEIRVRCGYRDDGKNPPKNLRRLVEEALGA
jgi:hypothetical protein